MGDLNLFLLRFWRILVTSTVVFKEYLIRYFFFFSSTTPYGFWFTQLFLSIVSSLAPSVSSLIRYYCFYSVLQYSWLLGKSNSFPCCAVIDLSLPLLTGVALFRQSINQETTFYSGKVFVILGLREGQLITTRLVLSVLDININITDLDTIPTLLCLASC
jgi:hypothetical protein